MPLGLVVLDKANCDFYQYNIDQAYRGYPLIGGPYLQEVIAFLGMFYLNFTYGQSNSAERFDACIVMCWDLLR